jgi:hypothetical protein
MLALLSAAPTGVIHNRASIFRECRMPNVERVVEEFEVSSTDGQRVRVRKSLVVHVLRNPNDPALPSVRLNRAVYSGLARGGLERPVEVLGDDRFRIAGKEFTRLRAEASSSV